MGKIPGITRWVCDRCKKTHDAEAGDPEVANWGEPKRVNADGTESTSVLCPDCFIDYKSLVMKQQKQINDFLANRGGDI